MNLKFLILTTLTISLIKTQLEKEGLAKLAEEPAPISPIKVPTFMFHQPCPTNDCICENFLQGACKLVFRMPDHNSQWYLSSLNRNTDVKLLKGKVIAYKLRWFSGSWSGWYVPGFNDMDFKKNVAPNTLRRKWSYFSDHQHQAIICY